MIVNLQGAIHTVVERRVKRDGSVLLKLDTGEWIPEPNFERVDLDGSDEEE